MRLRTPTTDDWWLLVLDLALALAFLLTITSWVPDARAAGMRTVTGICVAVMLIAAWRLRGSRASTTRWQSAWQIGAAVVLIVLANW